MGGRTITPHGLHELCILSIKIILVPLAIWWFSDNLFCSYLNPYWGNMLITYYYWTVSAVGCPTDCLAWWYYKLIYITRWTMAYVAVGFSAGGHGTDRSNHFTIFSGLAPLFAPVCVALELGISVAQRTLQITSLIWTIPWPSFRVDIRFTLICFKNFYRHVASMIISIQCKHISQIEKWTLRHSFILLRTDMIKNWT